MKSILVFSNGEKIGDGIIKLPLLNEFKRRLPNYKLYWMTDQGSTVYASTLKNIASNYIYTFFSFFSDLIKDLLIFFYRFGFADSSNINNLDTLPFHLADFFWTHACAFGNE